MTKKKSKKPASIRMRTYTQRQKDRGLVHITIWVPKDYVASVRKMADQLRREHGRLTLRSKFLYGDEANV